MSEEISNKRELDDESDDNPTKRLKLDESSSNQESSPNEKDKSDQTFFPKKEITYTEEGIKSIPENEVKKEVSDLDIEIDKTDDEKAELKKQVKENVEDELDKKENYPPPEYLIEEEKVNSLGDAMTGSKLSSLNEEELRKEIDARTERYNKLKILQNNLRHEETTLVLLKKIRQSQMTPIQEPGPQINQNQMKVHSQQGTPNHVRQQSGPPPLVKGQQNSKIISSMNHNQMRNHNGSTPSRSQAQGQGPPPLVMSPRQSSGQANHQQQPSRSAPTHNSSRINSSSSQNQQRIHQQQMAAQKQSVQQPQHPPQDTQTPAQRQAAAKQALRKQLEKTLLQIPPPKPPPPEMNFIPSLACPDFILLLGLEEVVNHMIDFQLIARGQKNPDERFVCTPFTCVQCGSDFTPVWKREKPGSKNVICEHCVTTNQKKALKQEHTNRLKSAFVKALQQEQEIERMQGSSTAARESPQPPASSRSQREPSQHLGTDPPMISAAAAAANAAALASLRPSAEQLRQHQLLQQAQQAQLRAGQPLGLGAFSHRASFYQLPFAKQQELQRQYLIDMIPRGSMPWKQ